jgi:hypothetical protein
MPKNLVFFFVCALSGCFTESHCSTVPEPFREDGTLLQLGQVAVGDPGHESPLSDIVGGTPVDPESRQVVVEGAGHGSGHVVVEGSGLENLLSGRVDGVDHVCQCPDWFPCVSIVGGAVLCWTLYLICIFALRSL